MNKSISELKVEIAELEADFVFHREYSHTEENSDERKYLNSQENELNKLKTQLEKMMSSKEVVEEAVDEVKKASKEAEDDVDEASKEAVDEIKKASKEAEENERSKTSWHGALWMGGVIAVVIVLTLFVYRFYLDHYGVPSVSLESSEPSKEASVLENLPKMMEVFPGQETFQAKVAWEVDSEGGRITRHFIFPLFIKEESHQRFLLEDGKWGVTYSSEGYNYRYLCEELKLRTENVVDDYNCELTALSKVEMPSKEETPPVETTPEEEAPPVETTPEEEAPPVETTPEEQVPPSSP